MKIVDVQIVKRPLVLATAKQVADLESRLWIRFPRGYKEYITQLGEGILGGAFVRIYPPWRIEKELAEWRKRIDKFWFWDNGKKILPKDRALECVIIGDSVGGDELIFHPARPEKLYVLPREHEMAFDAGSDVRMAVEWMCSSGKLTEPFSDRDFEPFDSRKSRVTVGVSKASDAQDDFLDQTVASLQQWADRLKLSRRAEEEFRKWLGKYEDKFFDRNGKVIHKKNVTVKLQGHHLVLQGEMESTAFVATLCMFNSDPRKRADREEFGLFRWYTSSDGSCMSMVELYHDTLRAWAQD